MDETLDWLPELELFSDYGGDWDRYFEAIYQFFKADFIDDKPSFRGQRLGLKRHPVILGKEATFWHMISTGEVEADRLPDLRRCERIRWSKPIIENEISSEVRVWEEVRKGETRIHLWLYSLGYLVILNQRNGYLLPWTAYYVEYDHERKKLDKRWERYKKQ